MTFDDKTKKQIQPAARSLATEGRQKLATTAVKTAGTRSAAQAVAPIAGKV